MAFNDGYSANKQNNSKKEQKALEIYGPVSYKNPGAELDPTELSYGFWKNFLKLQISPKLERQENESFDRYDHKNNGVVAINHTKARILYDQITQLITGKLPDVHSVGVNTGSNGLLTFSDGTEFGISDHYFLIIRKLDEEGNVSASYSYQFNKGDIHFGIQDFNESTLDYTRVVYDEIEIYSFLDILKGYYESQSYAIAYTVADAIKFQLSPINTKVELVMDKLGIPRLTSGNNNSTNGPQRSYFDNNSGSQIKPASQGSFEDLE